MFPIDTRYFIPLSGKVSEICRREQFVYAAEEAPRQENQRNDYCHPHKNEQKVPFRYFHVHFFAYLRNTPPPQQLLYASRSTLRLTELVQTSTTLVDRVAG